LLRARTFGAAPRTARTRRQHTQAFVAFLAAGITVLIGAGVSSRLVQANDLHLAMSSLPGLPAAVESVRPAPQAAPAMARKAPSPGAKSAPDAESVAPSMPATEPAPLAPADATPNASLAAVSAALGESASEQRVSTLLAEESGTAEASNAPKEPPPLYQPYVVQAGDTVSGIAARFGVRAEDIVVNNAGVISDQSLLVTGASLQVPTLPGVLHNIRVGETLAEIAEQYGVTVDDIVSFPGNRISDAGNVIEGTQILVVNGEAPAAQGGPTGSLEAPIPTPEPAEATPEATPEPAPPPVQKAAPAALTFIWPVQGRVTSYFGPSHPLGIDISIAYAPVAASAAGKVVFAGGDACCSYGYYIDIQHADGYVTRYAHLSKFLVKLGQQVEQGETIAVSGNSGYSTGAHVHFEIRRLGALRNPLDFLP